MMARRRLGGFALAVALGLIAVARAAPAQDRWETYTKPRFGTIADYPVDLLTVQFPPPENGDGASFCTADGRAQLSIYGAYNVDNDMPQSYVAKFDHLNAPLTNAEAESGRLPGAWTASGRALKAFQLQW
ncbi:MAG: hypothetical protein WA717_02650 [Methyloceanibacter sp.]